VQISTTSKLSSTEARPGAHRAGWIRRLTADILFVARRDRKWWLLPLVVLLLLMAAFIVIGSSLGPLAPFIYPLF
jgi:hypothetical protein